LLAAAGPWRRHPQRHPRLGPASVRRWQPIPRAPPVMIDTALEIKLVHGPSWIAVTQKPQRRNGCRRVRENGSGEPGGSFRTRRIGRTLAATVFCRCSPSPECRATVVWPDLR
jgi:hypothetical protein